MDSTWQLLSRRPGSAGYLPIETQTFRLPDGSESDWDVYGREASVGVLALTEAREVVLVRQFRPGPGALLDELPGGYVEAGEEVLVAAARELREETGYAGELELIGASWLSATSRTRRFAVVASNARVVGPPTPGPGEFCEVLTCSLEEFRRHLRGGALTDVDLGYLALDHLGLLGEG